MDRINVGLIFGGKSGEHDVSLKSAASVYRAMDKEKYNIYLIGITKEGRWAYCNCTPESMERGKWLEHEIKGAKINIIPSSGRRTGIELIDGNLLEIDVCLPVLHGPYGEDGSMQGLLEMAEIPYVGCKVLASSLAMDKAMFKKVMVFEGIPQVDYECTTKNEFEKDKNAVIERIQSNLNYPMFIKPANLGSSVGISKADTMEELIEGIEIAFSFDKKIVIEKGLDVREIEVAVLEDGDIKVSAPGEAISCADFYSYDAKYLAKESETIIPAHVDPNQISIINDLAKKAFKAIDGNGISRIDFFIENNTGNIYLNEINTMPGFTKSSMYPKLWEATGIQYTDLLDKLIHVAMENHSKSIALTCC